MILSLVFWLCLLEPSIEIQAHTIVEVENPKAWIVLLHALKQIGGKDAGFTDAVDMCKRNNWNLVLPVAPHKVWNARNGIEAARPKIDLIDELTWKKQDLPIIVMGYSDGGEMAPIYAYANPTKVKGCIQYGALCRLKDFPTNASFRVLLLRNTDDRTVSREQIYQEQQKYAQVLQAAERIEVKGTHLSMWNNDLTQEIERWIRECLR